MSFFQVYIRKFKSNPLQVRMHKRSDFGKKTFLSVSAAMTLEAALVLTLFIFAAVCLILPMKILNTERRIQAGLEAVGEDFSRYGYVKDVLEKGYGDKIPGVSEFAQAFCKHLAAGAAEGYAQSRALEYADTGNVFHVRMNRSQILVENEVFDLILDYEIRMPFPVLGLSGVKRTARSRRRSWVGRPGIGDGSDGEGAEVEDVIVYVGKGSTRYHKRRSCHYLSNDLSTVPYTAIDDLRNSGGGKYYPCSRCGSGAKTGSSVYIMPSGSSFHTDRNCNAIIAYVRAVKLSEVSHLGACSYCSGG